MDHGIKTAKWRPITDSKRICIKIIDRSFRLSLARDKPKMRFLMIVGLKSLAICTYTCDLSGDFWIYHKYWPLMLIMWWALRRSWVPKPSGHNLAVAGPSEIARGEFRLAPPPPAHCAHTHPPTYSTGVARLRSLLDSRSQRKVLHLAWPCSPPLARVGWEPQAEPTSKPKAPRRPAPSPSGAFLGTLARGFRPHPSGGFYETLGRVLLKPSGGLSSTPLREAFNPRIRCFREGVCGGSRRAFKRPPEGGGRLPEGVWHRAGPPERFGEGGHPRGYGRPPEGVEKMLRLFVGRPPEGVHVGSRILALRQLLLIVLTSIYFNLKIIINI